MALPPRGMPPAPRDQAGPRGVVRGARSRRGSCLVNGALALVGLLGGAYLALRWLGPPLLARPLAITISRELSEAMPGSLELPEVRLSPGGGWTVPSARLLGPRGQILLQADLAWTPLDGSGGELAITGLTGQLERDAAGRMDLLAALPEEGAAPLLFVREALGLEPDDLLKLRLELAPAGLALRDPAGTIGSWNEGALTLEHVGDADALNLSGRLASSDGLGTALELELTGAFPLGRPSWPSMTILTRVQGLRGASVDRWVGLDGRLAAWLEDTADVELRVSGASATDASQTDARVSVDVLEPEGTRLRGVGLLNDERLLLQLVPGVARLDAGAGILTGNSGEGLATGLQPELVLDPSEDLEGRLTEGRLVWPFDGAGPRVEFDLDPERFPALTLNGAPFEPEVDSLRFELDEQGRRAAYRGELPDAGGRFVMDLTSRGRDAVRATVTLRDLEAARLESWLETPQLLEALLGSSLEALLVREAPGAPLDIALRGDRGAVQLALAGGRLTQPTDAPAAFEFALDDPVFAPFVGSLLPWFRPTLEGALLEVPVRLLDLDVVQGNEAASSWRLELDLRGVPLRLDGVLGSVLADPEAGLLLEGSLEPVVVRVQAGAVRLESASFSLGGEPVALTGEVQLDGSDSRIEASLPTSLLEPSLLGLGDLPLTRARSDSRVSVEFSGPVGSERVRADLNALQRIRTFLESLLPLGG